MPYYRAGDYYRGDYYRGNYQAGGLFGGLGKVLKKVAGTALRAVPGVSLIKSAVDIGSLLVNRQKPVRPQIDFSPDVDIPAFRGFAGPGPPVGFGGGMLGGRRRRLDPLNVKALRRAGRRLKGFLRIARRLGALPVAGGKGKRVFKVARRKK